MRMRTKIVASVASVATVAVFAAGPALADPAKTPRPQDIVTVGANTTQSLFDQLSVSYNKTVTTSATRLYTYDTTGSTDITPKTGCTPIVRPNGSGAGKTALEQSQSLTSGTGWCVDFARSASNRSASDPACATSGICYVDLAGDAVDWTTTANSDAPASLTVAQLQKIYECSVTNWSKVGGKSAPIEAFLPQTQSGVRTFFLAAIGVTTPGSCVSDGATSQFPAGTIQENEGQDPVLNSPEAIFPYSVADWISQAYRSAACTSGCGGTVSDNPVCAPSGAENKYGCNLTGALTTLGEIQGTKPTTPWPPPAQPVPPKVNDTVKISTHFDVTFQRIIFDIVRYGTSANPIPGYLQPILGPTGYACSTAGVKYIKDYGFLALSSGENACGDLLNGTG
jgi:ABC-type phosphate transport system substrate-binding protein